MNEEKINSIIEVCLLKMQGKNDYELVYQSAISPEIAFLGLQLATYLKFLINENESQKEVKNETENPKN